MKISNFVFLLATILVFGACGPRTPNYIVDALTHEDDGGGLEANGGFSSDDSDEVDPNSTLKTYYYDSSGTTSKLEIVGQRDLKSSWYGRWTPNILHPEIIKIVPLKENNE